MKVTWDRGRWGVLEADQDYETEAEHYFFA